MFLRYQTPFTIQGPHVRVCDWILQYVWDEEDPGAGALVR